MLFFGGDEEAALGVRTQLAAEFSDIMDHFFLPQSDNVAKAFGTEKPFIVMLRPDNYIGLLTSQTDLEVVRKYMHEVLLSSVTN